MMAETMDSDHGVVVQELTYAIRDQLAAMRKSINFSSGSTILIESDLNVQASLRRPNKN
jgi:hypothetical protein